MALIRLPEVLRESGLSRSSVYHFIDVGLFPKPVKIGERAVAWIESEIAQVNSARIAGRTPDQIRLLIRKIEAERGG